MKKQGVLYIIITLALGLGMGSCKKFLDAKSDQKLAVPSNVDDFQALLDRNGVMTTEPKAGELNADDFFLTESDWASLASEEVKRTYIWAPDFLFD